MRGQREGSEEQERVGEVQGEVDGARRGAILRGMAEEDKERSEEGFVDREDQNGGSPGAGEVAARGGGEGPEEEGEDADEIDAAGGPVGKLDEGGDGGVMLDQGSVAERPVVPAAGAGAGGADSRAPDNDGYVVREDPPGKAAQRSWGASRRGSVGGDGGDHARFRSSIVVRGLGGGGNREEARGHPP